MFGKVLVVMPCYNAEETVIESIDSVYNQTYKNYILVCCDDTSTDNTFNILKENQNKYNYVLYKNDKNLGTGDTVNKCIKTMCENTHFDYLTWVSSDNTLKNNFLEEHISKLNEGFAITYSGWSTSGRINITNQLPYFNLLELKKSYRLGPSFVFRKKLWDVAGPFNKLPGEDYYFAVNCALNDAKFGFINKVLVNYLSHINSVSGRIENGKITELCTYDAINNAQGINKINGEKIYD